ncbi:hypothetical protein SSS_05313 [Sarcoptes scabiei]|uniref:Uncharacterized protein n=1 Tax=Sarcoptes scabiei TaxID=52283 RepID=A0A834R7I4_SARSC|nr:hypothetical protein SSS_05313 [Sarcoptes scabiei]
MGIDSSTINRSSSSSLSSFRVEDLQQFDQTQNRVFHTISLFFCLITLVLVESNPSNEIETKDIPIGSFKAYLSQRVSSSGCPKSLNCTEGFFDEGKDCYEANRQRCNCIAHCCFAFDCRDWGHLVQCRRKCGVIPNRFGLKRTDRNECDKFVCQRDYYDSGWDSRNSNDQQRNCIGHCCFAFDCRRSLGYCRHACGVESWVTARPLG